MNKVRCEIQGAKYIILTLCLASCAVYLMSGCYYGIEPVNIKVKVDSKIDMSKYRTIAVMDFIDNKDKSDEDCGRILARMIRKQLKDSKEFQVLDERTIYAVLGEGVDKDKIEDPNTLVSMCQQVGADALIIGTFDFYQINQPVPFAYERYSSGTGRYSPGARTYVQKMQRLSFRARLIDGATGKTILDYAPPSEERPEYRNFLELPFSNSKPDPSNLRNIAVRPVKNLVQSLIPHYEDERRILIQ